MTTYNISNASILGFKIYNMHGFEKDQEFVPKMSIEEEKLLMDLRAEAIYRKQEAKKKLIRRLRKHMRATAKEKANKLAAPTMASIKE
jgi:hypothetical protein|tara:strand:+ start:513 stop:776 length:264 start_codon:yes stop_codon:yes gene_type:complete